MKNFIRCRKGQGTTEYIVILAIAVALVVAFWTRIRDKLNTRVSATADSIATVGIK